MRIITSLAVSALLVAGLLLTEARPAYATGTTPDYTNYGAPFAMDENTSVELPLLPDITAAPGCVPPTPVAAPPGGSCGWLDAQGGVTIEGRHFSTSQEITSYINQQINDPACRTVPSCVSRFAGIDSQYAQARNALMRSESPVTTTMVAPVSCAYGRDVPGPDIKSTAWNCNSQGFNCGFLRAGQYRSAEAGLLMQLVPGQVMSVPYTWDGSSSSLRMLGWFGTGIGGGEVWLSSAPGAVDNPDCFTSGPGGSYPQINVANGYCQPPSVGFLNVKINSCPTTASNNGAGNSCLVRVHGASGVSNPNNHFNIQTPTNGGQTYQCPVNPGRIQCPPATATTAPTPTAGAVACSTPPEEVTPIAANCKIAGYGGVQMANGSPQQMSNNLIKSVGIGEGNFARTDSLWMRGKPGSTYSVPFDYTDSTSVTAFHTSDSEGFALIASWADTWVSSVPGGPAVDGCTQNAGGRIIVGPGYCDLNSGRYYLNYSFTQCNYYNSPSYVWTAPLHCMARTVLPIGVTFSKDNTNAGKSCASQVQGQTYTSSFNNSSYSSPSAPNTPRIPANVADAFSSFGGGTSIYTPGGACRIGTRSASDSATFDAAYGSEANGGFTSSGFPASVKLTPGVAYAIPFNYTPPPATGDFLRMTMPDGSDVAINLGPDIWIAREPNGSGTDLAGCSSSVGGDPQITLGTGGCSTSSGSYLMVKVNRCPMDAGSCVFHLVNPGSSLAFQSPAAPGMSCPSDADAGGWMGGTTAVGSNFWVVDQSNVAGAGGFTALPGCVNQTAFGYACPSTYAASSIRLQQGTMISVRYRTGASVTPSGVLRLSDGASSSAGIASSVAMSFSDTPGSFMVDSRCQATGAAGSTPSLTLGGSGCPLQPNTYYYLNVRVDGATCPSTGCRFVVTEPAVVAN